jgi:hypothetical protein
MGCSIHHVRWHWWHHHTHVVWIRWRWIYTWHRYLLRHLSLLTKWILCHQRILNRWIIFGLTLLLYRLISSTYKDLTVNIFKHSYLRTKVVTRNQHLDFLWIIFNMIISLNFGILAYKSNGCQFRILKESILVALSDIIQVWNLLIVLLVWYATHVVCSSNYWANRTLICTTVGGSVNTSTSCSKSILILHLIFTRLTLRRCHDMAVLLLSKLSLRYLTSILLVVVHNQLLILLVLIIFLPKVWHKCIEFSCSVVLLIIDGHILISQLLIIICETNRKHWGRVLVLILAESLLS